MVIAGYTPHDISMPSQQTLILSSRKHVRNLSNLSEISCSKYSTFYSQRTLLISLARPLNEDVNLFIQLYNLT